MAYPQLSFLAQPFLPEGTIGVNPTLCEARVAVAGDISLCRSLSMRVDAASLLALTLSWSVPTIALNSPSRKADIDSA